MAMTAVWLCLIFFHPLAHFMVDGEPFRLMVYGVNDFFADTLVEAGSAKGGEPAMPTFSISLTVLLAITTLVPLVTIFLYKKRLVQIRLLAAETVLLLGSAGMLGYYVWLYRRIAEDTLTSAYLFWGYIVLALLANILAIRGVWRDEKLVRSADRIR
jgi:hypothetical protein